MNPPAPAPLPTERDPRLRLLIPLVVGIAFLMEQLDATIVTTAIPAMARSLGASPVRLSLAVTAYVLTLAVFIPLSAWFADRFGVRRIFALALLLFTGGSALCGLADSLNELVLARVLQGFGGAMMTPVGRLVLLRSFPRSELVRAMTYMTVPGVIGPVLGPLVGGALTTYVSWRWIFYVNLPFGLLGIVLALRYFDDAPGDAAARFDHRGFVLFGGAVALLQGALELVGHRALSPVVAVAVLSLALVAVALYRAHARRFAAPVVDLGLLRQRSFAVATLAGGLCRIAMNGAAFLLPLMLQLGFGMSAVQSGLLTFLSAASVLGVRLFIGRVLRAFGFAGALIGSGLVGALVIAGFGLIGAGTPRWVIGGYVMLFGALRSVQFISSNTLAYAEVAPARLSHATSLGGLIQQLTVSFGVSLSAQLLVALAGSGHALQARHFHAAFVLLGLLPLLALPGFLRLRPEDGAQVSGHQPR